MRQWRLSIICAVIASVLAAPLAAQEPQCAMPNANATAACNTAVDAMRAFHPLAGMIVSGGNPVLGTAGSLGGIGHLTVTARVNAIQASLPNPDSASQSQVPSSFHGAIPAPIVEAALGLLRGRGGFLSVDALGSAVLLPTSGGSGLSVDSNAAGIGGAALGIGVDHYSSSQTTIRFHDASTPTSVTTIVINPANTREVAFVDGGLSLAALKLVAELGYQTGKDQHFTTNFSNFDPKAGHVFGGVGLRFGF